MEGQIQNLNSMIFEAINKSKKSIQRVDEAGLEIVKLTNKIELVSELKMNKAEHETLAKRVQEQMATLYENVDKLGVSMYKIEHFIDVYVPIQIHNSICESLKATLPKGSLSRLEIHEIEKM